MHQSPNTAFCIGVACQRPNTISCIGGLEIVVSHDIDAVSLNLLSRQHFEKVKNLQTISIDKENHHTEPFCHQYQ